MWHSISVGGKEIKKVSENLLILNQISKEGFIMSKNYKAKADLSGFKAEVARDLGVSFKEYNGDLSARQCGSVGGEMVKRMVEDYESKHGEQ